MSEEQLREVRMLAATMFASFMAHGVRTDAAIEQSLEAAEKMLARSIERDAAAQEVERNATALAPRNNGGNLARRNA